MSTFFHFFPPAFDRNFPEPNCISVIKWPADEMAFIEKSPKKSALRHYIDGREKDKNIFVELFKSKRKELNMKSSVCLCKYPQHKYDDKDILRYNNLETKTRENLRNYPEKMALKCFTIRLQNWSQRIFRYCIGVASRPVRSHSWTEMGRARLHNLGRISVRKRGLLIKSRLYEKMIEMKKRENV